LRGFLLVGGFELRELRGELLAHRGIVGQREGSPTDRTAASRSPASLRRNATLSERQRPRKLDRAREGEGAFLAPRFEQRGIVDVGRRRKSQELP